MSRGSNPIWLAVHGRTLCCFDGKARYKGLEVVNMA